MSVEFSNTYQEILFDNLISIIKQNFIFQTQLKIAEESGKVTAEIQTKYNEANPMAVVIEVSKVAIPTSFMVFRMAFRFSIPSLLRKRNLV